MAILSPGTSGPGTLLAFHGAGAVLGVAPFASLLACIAVLPLVPRLAPWWERLGSKALLSLAAAGAGTLSFVLAGGDPGATIRTLLEYLAFIALLGSLYQVSGGIHITGAFSGLPWLNTAFLALGGILANVMGTTGASMVLLRPLLHANRRRGHRVHVVVFFLFVVSNSGGLLTPLGDPPLFLGFLRGVPFTWTLKLLPQWALVQGLVLTVFHFLDEILFHREELETKAALTEALRKAEKPIHLEGRPQAFLLLVILGTVLGGGAVVEPFLSARLEPARAAIAVQGFQILVLGGLAGLSIWLRSRPGGNAAFRHNGFSYVPLAEVALLFFGLFAAMLPVLAVLQELAPRLPLAKPWHFFWASGLLSSFLDNAPTYLGFATLAAAKSGLASHSLAPLASTNPELLKAVACGSVLMGANTYIGNGPNFMVKAIAEHAGVKMPSFLGYMAWSLGVLVPVFVVVSLVFFR
ncbi:MAG: sodium:proton antiporter [Acidobacteria bacterium]|nr:sodium:proton antiporter [Acidobacteriota bacterium]